MGLVLLLAATAITASVDKKLAVISRVADFVASVEYDEHQVSLPIDALHLPVVEASARVAPSSEFHDFCRSTRAADGLVYRLPSSLPRILPCA